MIHEVAGDAVGMNRLLADSCPAGIVVLPVAPNPVCGSPGSWHEATQQASGGDGRKVEVVVFGGLGIERSSFFHP